MCLVPCFVGVTMTRRKPWEVSDELWAVIEPLLPKHERRFRYPARQSPGLAPPPCTIRIGWSF